MSRTQGFLIALGISCLIALLAYSQRSVPAAGGYAARSPRATAGGRESAPPAVPARESGPAAPVDRAALAPQQAAQPRPKARPPGGQRPDVQRLLSQLAAIEKTYREGEIDRRGPIYTITGKEKQALQIQVAELLSTAGLETGFALLLGQIQADQPGYLLASVTLRALANWPDPDNPQILGFLARLLNDAPWLFEKGGLGDPMAEVLKRQSGPETELVFRKWHTYQPGDDLLMALAETKLANRLDLILEFKPTDPIGSRRSYWLSAVGTSRDPRALPILAEEWEKGKRQRQARNLLLEFPHPDAIPYLERVIEKTPESERDRVLRSMGRLGSASARRQLVERLRSPDIRIQESASACLDMLFGITFGPITEPRGPPDQRKRREEVNERIRQKWETWQREGFDRAKKPWHWDGPQK